MKLEQAHQLFEGVLRGEVALEDPRLREAFVSDARLAAPERMNVYAEMYLGRQVDALRAEFPQVAKLLGDCAFDELASDYVRAHPSDHPDIGQLGRRLADFIRAHPVRGDLAELAALERARSIAFLAADAEPRDWAELAQAGAEGFAGARLRFVPSLATLEAAHDLPSLWRALSDGPELPGPSRLERPATLAIWKSGFEVFHAALVPAEADALARARQGVNLGEVCEAFANEEDPANAAFTAIASWFEEGWVAEIVHDDG